MNKAAKFYGDVKPRHMAGKSTISKASTTRFSKHVNIASVYETFEETLGESTPWETAYLKEWTSESISEFEPTEKQLQNPPLKLDDLISIQRRGVLARAAPDEPRGNRATAAPRRITPDTASMDLYKQALVSSDDAEVQAAAAGVLGEYGGTSEVQTLGDILVPRAPRVRRAAAAALANIGGPEAEKYLLRAIESDAPVKVREQALMGLADLVTRGWETYLMSPRRMKLPEDLRRRLEALSSDPELGPATANVLRAFD